jgi:hypothetical protein
MSTAAAAKPYPWYYVWSPKYEIFHQILKFGVADCPHFAVHDKFFPQSAFTTLYQAGAEHFFAGNFLKFDMILEALAAHAGTHIIVSDADIIVDRPADLAAYLAKYENYDIAYMRDNFKDDTYNIGFALIKSSPATIAFFTAVRDCIRDTGRQDQAVVNEQIPRHPICVGMFSVPEMCQSNMGMENVEKSLVMQMLCSNDTYEANLREKLLTASAFIDLRGLRHLIPTDIWEFIVDFHKTHDTRNPNSS